MVGIPDFRAYQGKLPRHDGIAVLSSAEAYECLRRGAVLVDLRETYETNFRVFDVPDAIYAPWTKFESIEPELPRDRPLVIADAVGIYARQAAAALAAAGYENIAYLAGGMVEWDNDGLPVRRDVEYELGGQCACKIKTRSGENPLMAKPAQREPERGADRLAGVGKTRVLFLCVHNSARSQMAAAFLERHAGGDYAVESAGLEAGKLNPFVVRAMAERGIDISGNSTKTVFALEDAGAAFDVVVTVCSKEASERCPIFPGRVERLHWPFDDPSAFQGSDDDIMARVRAVRDDIERAVLAFVASRA